MAETETKEKEEPSQKSEPEQKKEESEDSMADKIEGTIRKVLGKLLDSGEVTVEEKASDKPSTGEPSKPATPREEERSMEEMVKAAVEKLKSETPSESTEKQLPPKETQPETTARKVERFLWGVK